MEGVRVLEVALYAFVPAAGAILAEWGAEVIKVEHPEHGDPMRGTVAWGIQPGTGGFTYMWEVCNRGKRAVGVTCATLTAASWCCSWPSRPTCSSPTSCRRPARSCGIDVEDVMARNPRIIYARGSGQGPSGPDAEQGGFDGLTYWSARARPRPAAGPKSAWPASMPGPGFGDVQSGMAPRRRCGRRPLSAGAHRRGRGGRRVAASAGMWAMQPTIVAANLTGVDDAAPSSDRFERRTTRSPTPTAPPTAASRSACWRATATGRASARSPARRPRRPIPGSPTSAAARPTARPASIGSTALFAERPLEEWQDTAGPARTGRGRWSRRPRGRP